jgi:hypothetical protein
VQKRTRECQTAAHPFRELCDEPVAVLFQSYALQCAPGSSVPPPCNPAKSCRFSRAVSFR